MKSLRTNLLALGLSMTAIVALADAPTNAPSSAAAPTPAPVPPRTTISFDPGWQFLKDDAQGAEAPNFDDSTWRSLSVPHDWSIEGPFDEKNPTGGAGAFLPAGIGWYRKHFTLPQDDAQKRVFIDFDGVMANSDVWINGFHLGKRPYGYVSFRYELTGHLTFGDNSPNVLAVRADNSGQPASRWYSGAGIYRHVRLVVTNPVHLDHWGTFVTTPSISADKATVHVQSTVVNQSDSLRQITLQLTVVDPSGKPVAMTRSNQTVAAGQSVDFQQDIPVSNPQIWDLDHPLLYHLQSQVADGTTTLDNETTSFGIREFHFDAATGFWLNGNNFKIKGVCLHGDVGALGTAVPLRAWEKRLTALKQLGVNAIRTSHNPPSPEFLDLCDRLGLLVMDEMFDCWTVAKNPYDYHLYFNDWSITDLTDSVRRDRNHPSIILYSAGNEIHDTPKADLAKGILKGLVDAFHQNDPTRPVTQALFRPNTSHDYDDGLADMLDVVGQNYRENELVAAHESNPDRKIIGTENGHDRSYWVIMRDNPAYAGQFLWTGVDYLGEAHKWPSIGSKAGLLDRTDAPRPLAFQRQSWWDGTPMVCIARDEGNEDTGNQAGEPQKFANRASDWTPANTGDHQEKVEVYSNCDEVELFLNDESLGSQQKPADDSPRVWNVDFKPGTLKASAKNGGQEVATQVLQTAGPAAKILLETDRDNLSPTWDDISYVRATVVDANNVPVPSADDLITFAVTGPGAVAAVDNADMKSQEPFQASERHAYHGTCIAIIRATAATGQIQVTATATGLTDGSVSIHAVSPAAAP
jgi:beta-galactosidase